MKEIEVKVLGINKENILEQLENLGAEKIGESRLVVDWFRVQGVKEGEDPWYLRIRSYNGGRYEVTWKGRSDETGITTNHKEINFMIEDPEKLSDLFQELGLEKYAHQEKDRISYRYKGWQIDIDDYPGMPTFLEIEGESEQSILEAMNLLGVENNQTWNKGERILIQDVYHLDWYDMRF